MELRLYHDQLKPSSKKYANRFSLEKSDFLPNIQKLIESVLENHGRIIFIESPGSYVAITH